MAEVYLNRIIKAGEGGDELVINGSSDLVGVYQETIEKGDTVYSVEEPASGGTTQWDDNATKLSGINMDDVYTNAFAWSSDDRYLAHSINGEPYVSIYKRAGDTFTKLANPSTLATGVVTGVSFSPNDEYLALSHTNSPFVTIYKRSGDTFTKLANPSTLPAYDGKSVAWSPDSTYLFVGNWNPPYYRIYKRSGDTFTNLTVPTISSGQARGASWSPDGVYLSIANDATPFIHILKRSGDTFTKLANPSNIPLNKASVTAWSPDGTYLAVGWDSTTPYFLIYKRSGDTFTKLADPSDMPINWVGSVSFTNDGNYLSVYSSGQDGYIILYKRSGDTFTKTTTISNTDIYRDIPTYTSRGLSSTKSGFSNNSYMLYQTWYNVSSMWSYYTDIYKTTMIDGTPSYNKIYKISNDISDINIITMKSIGYAKESGDEDDEKTISSIWKAVE